MLDKLIVQTKALCGIRETRIQNDRACIACAGKHFRTVLWHGPYTLKKCLHCTLVCADPIPSAAVLSEMYASPIDPWFPYLDFFGNRKLLRNYFSALLETLGAAHGSRLLEIGIGNGLFSEVAREMGFDVTGVERCLEACQFNREMYGAKVINEDVEKADLPASFFDVVILYDIIEHVTDPVQLTRKIADSLKPGGKCLVATPNINSTERWLFGRHWECLTPPWHLYFFSYQTLTNLFKHEGLVLRKKLPDASRNAISKCMGGAGFSIALQNKLVCLFEKVADE